MVASMNIFRILADVSHSLSIVTLIYVIHNNRSAEGISLLTQLLYALVFATRYLDLFWTAPGHGRDLWNFVLKICFLTSSAYIIFIMMRVFARTREKEYGWKLAIWSLVGSFLGAPVVCLLFEGWKATTFAEILWTFSIILESVCVLPQLLLLRQTTVPTVLDSFYLVTLGSYRFFYILNWLVELINEGKFVATTFVFGVVQTALYVDFAWVYLTRQRVKLRGGGLVDSEDLRKSYLVRRFIGRPGNRNSTDGENEDEEDADTATLSAQENGTIRPSASRSGRSWGARGISVSADQPDDDDDDDGAAYLDSAAGDAQIVDPSHFEDNSDDDAGTDAPPPPAKNTKSTSIALDDDPNETAPGLGSSAVEWRDGGSK